jgi:hypothetical protein
MEVRHSSFSPDAAAVLPRILHRRARTRYLAQTGYRPEPRRLQALRWHGCQRSRP